MAIEFDFFVLIQDPARYQSRRDSMRLAAFLPVEEAVMATTRGSTINDILKPLVVKFVHLVGHILRPRSPVAHQLLRDSFKKWKNVHGWCIPGFHDLTPILHQRIELLHMSSLNIRRACAIDQTHDDTVGEALRMSHVAIRLHDEVMHHLDCLSIDQLEMLLHDYAFGEVLVDQFSASSPLVTVLHEKDMVAAANDAIADVSIRSMTVDIGFLVDKSLNQIGRCNNNGCARAHLKREYAAILFRPFTKPVRIS